jgi:hypothetical protein
MEYPRHKGHPDVRTWVPILVRKRENRERENSKDSTEFSCIFHLTSINVNILCYHVGLTLIALLNIIRLLKVYLQ